MINFDNGSVKDRRYQAPAIAQGAPLRGKKNGGAAIVNSNPIQASGTGLEYGYDLNRRSVRCEWKT